MSGAAVRPVASLVLAAGLAAAALAAPGPQQHVTQAQLAQNQRELADVDRRIAGLRRVLDGGQQTPRERELTLLQLNQLSQRRNQLAQFASNAMAAMNEGSKDVIANMR